MNLPKISICIPAYKRTNYLERLLDSINTQTFIDFEVIISDDSDDDSVAELIKKYKSKFTIIYFKNTCPLGTPANWNYAISKAKGEWIKLMHDDDWFKNNDSLEKFEEATRHGKKMIVSGYSNFIEQEKFFQNVASSSTQRKKILNQPFLLLANNIIGPPSVTMFHNSIIEKYDERLKWRVDLEFYIRVLLKENSFHYISSNLIAVGVSESQVTNYCINIPTVEIPESFILLSKFGTNALDHIIVYDAFWRIYRNCTIRSINDLQNLVPSKWPRPIEEMINFQGKFGIAILKNGYLSKILMTISYLQHLTQRKNRS